MQSFAAKRFLVRRSRIWRTNPLFAADSDHATMVMPTEYFVRNFIGTLIGTRELHFEYQRKWTAPIKPCRELA